MVNGSQKERYMLSFKLIDTDNKGFFTSHEFSLMISSMVSVWCTLTGSQISFHLKNILYPNTMFCIGIDINKRLEFYIKYIFDEMDQEHKGKISLNNYINSLEKCPDLLEIYDFMNNSFNSSSIFEASAKKQKDQEVEKMFSQVKLIENDIGKLANFIKEGKLPSPHTPTPRRVHEKMDFMTEKNEGEEGMEVDLNKSNQTFKKIDESVKRLLLRAHLNPESIVRPHESENINSEEMSERIVASKLSPLNRNKFKVFNVEFNRLVPKFSNNNIFGDIEEEEKKEFSPREFMEKERMREINLIKSQNNFGNAGNVEVANAIKKIQLQVKNLKNTMEAQIYKDYPEYFFFN